MMEQPFIFNFAIKRENEFKQNPLFYNIQSETNKIINENDINKYDKKYIFYATGSRRTNASGDPTRDEASDRNWY